MVVRNSPAARRALDEATREAARAAELAALPVHHPHAAGIDVGDTSHWVCVATTPDGSDTVREFPAHTPGLRQLVAWLRHCGVTTVALEATGVYGHVLYLTLLEAGLHVVTTSPKFAKQIQGRPKTDKRDCQWIQRLHSHGLLPPIFQPDEATHTLRDYVRQRANLVRLSGQHIQRMQKALELMNLKLTGVLGDVTGVTGLKIIRAIVAGERDPDVLASMRDVRCRESVETIRAALVGNYQPEHVFALAQALALYDSYQVQIGECDRQIEQTLELLIVDKAEPQEPLGAPRTRTKQTNSLNFDVRPLLHQLTGIDLTQIHGIGPSVALELVAECGTDLSRWPTEKHFTSWLTLSPGCKIS